LPFSLSLPWLWLDEELLLRLSAGRRMSVVIVGKEDGIFSLSSQRSMISDDGHQLARSDDNGAAAVVGLVKKEESFVCPASIFFCFVFPAPEESVRGRLRDSRGSCCGLREAWLVAGVNGDGGDDVSVSGWLDEDGGCGAFGGGGSSMGSGGSCVSSASKAVARADSPFDGAVGGGEISALRLVKKLDMSICFP
jgi:hypothetical protein